MKFAIALTLVLQTYAHTDASLDDLDITSFDSPDLDFREDFDDEKSDDESNDSEDSSNEATPVASPKKEKPKKSKATNTNQSSPYYASPDQNNQAYAAVSILYWTVSEPGLHCAALGQSPTLSSQNLPIITPASTIGSVKKARYAFSPGIRAEIANQFASSLWQLFAEYSYFQTSNDDTVSKPNAPGGYLAGMSVRQATIALADHLDTKTHFNYQNGKLLFGTTWNPNSNLFLRLQFGPQATWLRRNWNANFFPVAIGGGPIPPTSSYTLNTFENSSWGIGLFAGLQAEAHLAQGFALGVKMGIAGMSGQQKIHDYDEFLDPVTADVGTDFDVVQPKESYDFMGQGTLAVSLSYSRSFQDVAFRVEAAYEFNGLFNMLDVYRPGSTKSDLPGETNPLYQSNPIYLQGLSFKLGIGF